MAIKFDLSEIGSGATVLSATLRLYKYGHFEGFNEKTTYTVHTITKDWDEGNANWKNPWSAEGGDFSQTEVGSFDYDGFKTGWMEFTVTDAIQNMIGGTTDNFGFLVADLKGDDVDPDNSQQQELYTYSKEASDQSLQPQLVVNYDDNTEIVTEAPGKNTLKIRDLQVSGNKMMFHSPSDQTVSMSLYSACGRLVFNKSDLVIREGPNTFDLGAALSKGVYFFRFYTDASSGMYKYVFLVP